MSNITTFLKVIASVPILVGVLHLVLGLNADVLLGAKLPASVIADPALDSQNRFYGVTFVLYGVLLFVGGSDLKRYLPVVRWALWIFFAAGMSRLLSVFLYGFPPPLVITLLLLEGGGNSRSAGVAESFKPSRLAVSGGDTGTVCPSIVVPGKPNVGARWLLMSAGNLSARNVCAGRKN